MNYVLRMKVCEAIRDALSLHIVRHCKASHVSQTHQWKTWDSWIDFKVVSYVSIFYIRRDKTDRLLGYVFSKSEEGQDVFMIQQAPARDIINECLSEIAKKKVVPTLLLR